MVYIIKTNINKLTSMAVLVCAALVVFVIELNIPPLSPIPGVKPGLANIVTLFVICLGKNWSGRDAFFILIARVLLGAFITGHPSTLLYSLAGGVFALFAMIVIKKAIKWIPVPFLSVVGAVFHNFAQLIIAWFIFDSVSIFAYSPVLFLSGIVSGLFTGFAVYFFIKKSEITKFFNN